MAAYHRWWPRPRHHECAAPARAAPAKQATVYKSRLCGCCKKWVEHLQKNGYTVTAHDVPDVNVYKKRYAVPDELGSCHTAIVTSGYVVEGHVPADVIDKLVAASAEGRRSASPCRACRRDHQGWKPARQRSTTFVAFDKAGKTKVFAQPLTLVMADPGRLSVVLR